jgi:hypothetical protein
MNDTQLEENRFYANIQNALNRKIGTAAFFYKSTDLFDSSNMGGLIFQFVLGSRLFRLERDSDLVVHFYYSTPGTGTRLASIDLRKLTPAEVSRMMISWAPDKTQLLIGTTSEFDEDIKAQGELSKKQFRVGKDGNVHQLGDTGAEVSSTYLYFGDHLVLQPTAIESWHESLEAVDVLSKGPKGSGYIYEMVLSNVVISFLVTGFETYSLKRFLELEQEGNTPDTTSLIRSFFSKKEREKGIESLLENEAREKGRTLLEHLVRERKINFQSYNDCRRAFNKAYSIKFGELELSSDLRESLKKMFGYRHKIVHVSPMMHCFNPEETPRVEPVMAGLDLAIDAMDVFGQFVEALHASTLAVERTK